MSLIINGFENAGKEKCQHLSANKPKSLNFICSWWRWWCICCPAHGGPESILGWGDGGLLSKKSRLCSYPSIKTIGNIGGFFVFLNKNIFSAYHIMKERILHQLYVHPNWVRSLNTSYKGNRCVRKVTWMCKFFVKNILLFMFQFLKKENYN